MSNDRKIAGDLLVNALKTITQDRPDVHGSAEHSFDAIARLWSVYLEEMMFAKYGKRLEIFIAGYDVAQMMSLLKKVRAMFGQQSHPDHFIDDAGYTALAGMIATPEPVEETKPAPEQEGHSDPEPRVGIFKQPPMMEPTFGGPVQASRFFENDDNKGV